MVLYKCYRCQKEFKVSQQYTRHLLRKYPCKVIGGDQKTAPPNAIKKVLKCNEKGTEYQEKPEKQEIKKKITVYKCEACKRTFNHRQNKYAHMKICKKAAEKDKNQKIKELNQKLKELRLQKNIVFVNKLDHH